MQQYSVEVKREQMEEFENYLYERENAEATVKKYLSDITDCRQSPEHSLGTFL